jgi:hypothetical protein
MPLETGWLCWFDVPLGAPGQARPPPFLFPFMFHPASLIVVWIAAAVGLQQVSLGGLLVVAAVVIPMAFTLAPLRAWRLIRRSRWLLLSLSVLFVFATPGEYVSPIPGVTREGLQLAAEHLLRLALLLLLLSLLLEKLDNARLMSGMYLLLMPVAAVGFDRAKAVVRLMLVLEYVQGANVANVTNDTNGAKDAKIGTHWREWLAPPAETAPIPLRLPLLRLRKLDYVMLVMVAAALAGLLLIA